MSVIKPWWRWYHNRRRRQQWSPSSIPDIEFWYTAEAANITLNGANVSAWEDLSGNGRHLLQATAVKQPLWVGAGGPHGRGYVEFDGVQEWLQVATWGRAQPCTNVAHVLPTVGGIANGTVWDGPVGNSCRLYINAGPATTMYAGAGLTRPGGVYDPTTWGRLACTYNGVPSAFNSDGGVPTVGNAGAANGGGLSVGCFGSAGAYGDPRVDELIGYSRVLTADELAALDAWMTP